VRRKRLPAFWWVSSLLLFGGCASEHVQGTNLPPTVRITSGPVEGDTTLYSVRMSWSGEDPDGSIARFEYAIDPAGAFSEEEIANGGPGIVSQVLHGQNGDPDTTRVTKNGVASFDWIHTTETSHRFEFSTPSAESVLTGSGKVPTGRFLGMHAVYVRAVDNAGAVSAPDKAAFTAETIAPTSHIVRPALQEEILDMGPRMTLDWTGVDPDGTPQRPTGYQMKLLRLDTLSPPIPILQATPAVLLADPTPWVSIAPPDTPLVIPLHTPAAYILGVRAVDVAGAVEPFLDLGRNVFKFQAFLSGGKPEVTLQTAAGTFAFRGTAAPIEADFVAGLNLAVQVTCLAEQYGETCDGWRWGIDLVDLDSPEGWSDWTTASNLPETRFPAPGFHVFYLEARDAAGNTTQCKLILNILDAPFDREVLLVDDSFDNVAPTDAQNDAFWQDLIADYVAHSDLSLEQFFNFSAYGAEDRGTLMPQVPSLEELLRYKLVIWDSGPGGYNGDSALIRAALLLSPRLSVYLQAGGKVWLEGRAVRALSQCVGVCADLELVPAAESFLCRYFALCTNALRSPTKATDLMQEAVPCPGIGFPPLFADSSKGAIPDDVVLDPILEPPGFRGDIDSLYAHGAVGPRLQPPVSSSLEGKPIAIRWHDPAPDRLQGRTQWFGFRLYFFDVNGARETFQKTLDWFREEEPPQRPRDRP
jgi:hypothetical protein